MIIASHARDLPAKLSICLVKSNLARQFFIHYEWKFYGVCKRKEMSGQFSVLIISTVIVSSLRKKHHV